MIGSIGSSYNNYELNAVTSNVPEDMSAQASGDVEFSYNSQDRLVFEPTTTVVHDVKMGKNGPETSRIRLGKSELQPNADDKFVFDQGKKEFTGAVTFATVSKTLEMFESAYGAKVPWGGRGEQIKLVPDGGEMLNAYYSRRDNSLNFFHAFDPKNNTTVMTGESGEVVSHEVGHAMLDGIRPGYLSTWSPDPGGFHESFGDCIAMFMATQDDRVCERVAQETGGDLTKHNCLSATGEELGQVINNASGKNATGGNYVRDAINDFKWQDPSTLPSRPSNNNELSTEVHSWSRLFTGAVYDVMTGIVNRNMENGMEPAAAIKSAGAEMISLYGNLFKEAPKGDFTYEDMAKSMLKTDAKYMDGRNGDIIRECFTNRNILHGGASMIGSDDNGPQEFRMASFTLDGDGFGMFAGAKVETPVDAGKLSLSDDGQKLKDNMKRLIADGRILYTEPNQKIETKDLFDKDGVPYTGVVRWVDGEMHIERNTIIS
ncbi:hypothetical protein IJT17_02020 [bacterium]|nr:hypothetical protein [bacterium]